MYGFDSNTLKYLLLKLKSKFVTKSEADNKVDKVPGKQLSTNDFTDAFKAKVERIFDTVSVNYDDVSYDYELTFTRANKDSEKVLIPCNKKKPLGLVSDLDDAIIFNANKVNTLKFKMTSSTMYKDYSYRLRVYAVDSSNTESLIHSKTYSNDYFNDLNGELRDALDEITYDYTPDARHTKLIIDFRRLNNNNTSDYVDSQKIVIDVVVKYIIAIYTFKFGFDMLPTMDTYSGFTYAYKDTYNENGTVTRTLYTDKDNLPISISFKNRDGLVSIDYFDQASNTISVDGTFEGCADLVSGASNINESVWFLYNTYRDCTNLVFPGGRLHPSIRSMDNAYRNCINLTETLQERDASYFNTVTMDNTYAGCRNLTDGYVTGYNLVLTNTFADCPNLRNVYINTYSGKVINAQSMFANKNNSTRLNIYMTDYKSDSFDAFLVNNSNSIVGKDITWTTSISDFGRTMYYNNVYNIYVHSVDDVSFHRDLNEGKVITYGDLRAGFKIINNLKHKPIYVNGLDTYCKAYYKTNTQDCPTRVEIDSANRNIYNVYLSNDITNLYKSFYNSTVYRVHSSADITNMAIAFAFCNNAVTLPRSGNNTTTLKRTYYHCRSLRDAPACGPNVICMDGTYYNCRNITGPAVCGPNVTSMYEAYYNCINLTGNPACGPNVTNMADAYIECTNLNGNPVCGDSVEYMMYTYYNCYNLTGNPACGNNVINMSYAYYNCQNLTGSPVCGPNVTSMAYAYWNCTNLNNTQAIMIGESVKNLYGAFFSSSISNGCCNIYVKSRDVFNFHALSAKEATYGQQINIFVPSGTRTHNACILGQLSDLNSFNTVNYLINDDYILRKYINDLYAITAYVCHDVNKMYKMNELQILSYTAADSVVPTINYSNFTTETINDRNYLFKNNIDEEISHIDFSDKSSLTDINIHVKDVDSLYRSFYNCNELTSVSYYGRSTTNMMEAYYNCSNIKNSPSYGPNVVDMSSAFVNCTNLTGYATVGNSAVNLYNTFYGCKNLKSNAYIFSEHVQNAKQCFGGRNSLKRLNLYVPDNSITRATVLSQTINSVLGFGMSYTYDSLNNFYYNTTQNIYVYPVDNVVQTRLDNDGLITYISHNDSTTLPNVSNSCYTDEVFYNDPYRITTLLFAEENTGNLSSSIKMSDTKVVNVLGLSKRVTNLSGSFANSTTLKSFDANACHVINADSAFRGCTNLTNAINLNNATNMYYTYYDCFNLTGQPMCGDYVTNMTYAYYCCKNLLSEPVCGPNVTDMSYAYCGCDNLIGEAACGPNVVNFSGAYSSCENLTTAACGDNVKYMVSSYSDCHSLTTAACGPNVTNMYWCYYNCRNIREAVCGPNVVNLSGAYIDCDGLTTAVCGDKVTDMRQSYQACNNLTAAVCGPNVTDMASAYCDCTNLTTAVCGDKVTDMGGTYKGCFNLKNAYIGPNVNNTGNAFANCVNISNIVFANGLQFINTNTFTNLTEAIDVYFPSSISRVETNAFYNCQNITSYDFSAHTSELPYLGTNALGDINYNFSIYIQSGLYDTWSLESMWKKYNDKIIPLSDQATIIDNKEDNYILSFDRDSECVLKCIKFNEEDMENIEVSLSSEADNKISISYDYEIINEYVTNLIIVLSNCGVVTEEFTFDICINTGDFSFTKTITAIVYEVIPFSYEVLPVEGAAYGFELNANGYYESKNKGVNNSYALCKLVLSNSAGKNVYLDCINYAESSYDFGLISKIDTPLALSNTADSGVLHSFKNLQSASIQSVNLGTQSGTFYIKFRKDSSVNNNNDTLQFKVRVED